MPQLQRVIVADQSGLARAQILEQQRSSCWGLMYHEMSLREGTPWQKRKADSIGVLRLLPGPSTKKRKKL